MSEDQPQTYKSKNTKRVGQLCLHLVGDRLREQMSFAGYREEDWITIPVKNIKGKELAYDDFLEILSNITIIHYPDDATGDGGQSLVGETYIINLQELPSPEKFFTRKGRIHSFAPASERVEGE